MKAAGRFLVVKRTPGISTTDLVGRMLLCTRNHFIRSLPRVLAGDEGSANPEERRKVGEEMNQRIKDYATDESGLQPGPHVLIWDAPNVKQVNNITEDRGHFHTMVPGRSPQPGQRIVYVDGGFDLFSSGHIEFLRQVVLAEESAARKNNWYEGVDKTYSPAFIVAGVHDDEVINYWKGVNYPIMNIFERGLCVIQCRVRDSNLHLPVHAHGRVVYPLRDLLSSIYTKQCVPYKSAIRYAQCRLPWSDIVHATYIRSLHGGQKPKHLQGDWYTRFPGCQRW